MSSPSEPEEMVSISIERSFLPSRITEPLPNWRSIWESAADRALVLSMEDPSTIRRAVADMGRAPYGGDSLAGQTGDGTHEPVNADGTTYPICSKFAICSFWGMGGYIPLEHLTSFFTFPAATTRPRVGLGRRRTCGTLFL